ncbi:hypothetical protein COL922a_006865 [Colletotrichum nupharicola]|nr:hypothetical protein COL922a_006865 [Colletotrichum nupharicola]
MSSTTTNGTKLRIAVVGGGIAGLAAAAVLRQEHDVVVYDLNAPDAPERGAGIGLGPNGSKMLRKAFQFRADSVKATVCAGTRTYDKEGNLLREITGVTEPFGSEWLLMHRQDLKDELARLATGDRRRGCEPEMISSGASLYRLVYPLDKAKETLDGLPEAIDPRTGGFLNLMTADDDLHRNIIFYPCRNNTMLNVVARVPDSMLSQESETS